MSAKIIDGKDFANKRLSMLKNFRAELIKKPCLAIITVGNNPASEIYVRNKQKCCEQLNIDCIVIKKNYDRDIKCDAIEDDLKETIYSLNQDDKVTAIMIQLPLPTYINEDRILDCISPLKDVDGLTDVNMGKLAKFESGGIRPCTPKGIIDLLQRDDIDLTGKEVVIVGRSNIVGKPLAMMFLAEDCTVTVCHSYTTNLAQHTRNADILVVAVGKPKFITKDMVKPGAVVVDVGINRVDGKIVGDVSPDVAEVAGYMTPVPGGVGPVTVAYLIENVLDIEFNKENDL